MHHKEPAIARQQCAPRWRTARAARRSSRYRAPTWPRALSWLREGRAGVLYASSRSKRLKVPLAVDSDGVEGLKWTGPHDLY